MDIKEFWDIAHKHPEILRIVIRNWDRIPHCLEDPTLLNTYLGRDVIEHQIERIEFFDVDKLDQNSVPLAKICREEVEDVVLDDEECADSGSEEAIFVHYECYWHKRLDSIEPSAGFENEFKRQLISEVDLETSEHAENENRRTAISVGQMFKIITDQDGDVDAIVRVISRCETYLYIIEGINTETTKVRREFEVYLSPNLCPF